MYQWVEHTAEVELRIEATSEVEVFAEAMAALAELLSSDGEGESASHEVTASAVDRPTLLAEWLSELIYLADAERFVPLSLDRFELRGEELEAQVTGLRNEPRALVKAVTYHRLDMWQQDETWRARVILDV